MHRAPAVSYPAARSRWHLQAIIFLWALGSCASFFFIQSQARAEWMALVLMCVCATGAAALVAWRKAPSGILRWDGQCWNWSGFLELTPCQVELVVDLQQAMLVRVSSASARRIWLWLNAAGAAPQWIALRRAVVDGIKHQGKGRKTPDAQDEALLG